MHAKVKFGVPQCFVFFHVQYMLVLVTIVLISTTMLTANLLLRKFKNTYFLGSCVFII